MVRAVWFDAGDAAAGTAAADGPPPRRGRRLLADPAARPGRRLGGDGVRPAASRCPGPARRSARWATALTRAARPAVRTSCRCGATCWPAAIRCRWTGRSTPYAIWPPRWRSSPSPCRPRYRAAAHAGARPLRRVGERRAARPRWAWRSPTGGDGWDAPATPRSWPWRATAARSRWPATWTCRPRSAGSPTSSRSVSTRRDSTWTRRSRGGPAAGAAVRRVRAHLASLPDNGMGYGLLRQLNPGTGPGAGRPAGAADRVQLHGPLRLPRGGRLGVRARGGGRRQRRRRRDARDLRPGRQRPDRGPRPPARNSASAGPGRAASSRPRPSRIWPRPGSAPCGPSSPALVTSTVTHALVTRLTPQRSTAHDHQPVRERGRRLPRPGQRREPAQPVARLRRDPGRLDQRAAALPAGRSAWTTSRPTGPTCARRASSTR